MKTNIGINTAEDLVRVMAENEQIEDRVYELVFNLTSKYIEKVEENNEVEGTEVLDNNEEWYDEVRDDAMHILFEKLADFFNA